MSLNLPNFDDLSDDQLAVLTLPIDGSYLVTGPPGSGKTVMAILRAQALKKNFGEDALLLMYGKLLSQYTTAATAELEVDSIVSTLHKWFPKWFQSAYRTAPAMIGQWEFDWEAILRVVGANPPPEPLKLHVIIDEGQDLPQHLFLVMSHIAKTLTVFADENQALSESNSTIDEIRHATQIESEHKLTTNYRNTVEIAQVAAHFHQGIRTGIASVPPPPLRAPSRSWSGTPRSPTGPNSW